MSVRGAGGAGGEKDRDWDEEMRDQRRRMQQHDNERGDIDHHIYHDNRRNAHAYARDADDEDDENDSLRLRDDSKDRHNINKLKRRSNSRSPRLDVEARGKVRKTTASRDNVHEHEHVTSSPPPDQVCVGCGGIDASHRSSIIVLLTCFAHLLCSISLRIWTFLATATATAVAMMKTMQIL